MKTLKLYLSHPQNLLVEIGILVAQIYNAIVTAEWLGFLSHNATVSYGAIVGAYVIDGGYYTCLLMMRVTRYRGQQSRWWMVGAVIFSVLTFKNQLQFTALNWTPDVAYPALGWVGTVLTWLSTSGTDLLFKSSLTVFALIPLALIPPVKEQTVEDVEATGKVEIKRAEVQAQVSAIKQKSRQPGFLARLAAQRAESQRRAYEAEEQRRQQRQARHNMALALRARLIKQGEQVAHLSDDEVFVQAALYELYDPIRGTLMEAGISPTAEEVPSGDEQRFLQAFRDGQHAFQESQGAQHERLTEQSGKLPVRFTLADIARHTGWNIDTVRRRARSDWAGQPKYKIRVKEVVNGEPLVTKAELNRLMGVAAADSLQEQAAVPAREATNHVVANSLDSIDEDDLAE